MNELQITLTVILAPLAVVFLILLGAAAVSDNARAGGSAAVVAASLIAVSALVSVMGIVRLIVLGFWGI